MVWQDFMFACSVYELTPEFEANIRQEFIDNINVSVIMHPLACGAETMRWKCL